MILTLTLLPLFLNRRHKFFKCPNDCNGIGLCDSKTSKCICPPPFSGEDCSEGCA